MSSQHKECDPHAYRATSPDYICNPESGMWVKRNGKKGRELRYRYGDRFFGLAQSSKAGPPSVWWTEDNDQLKLKSHAAKPEPEPKVKQMPKSLAETLYDTPFGAPVPGHPLSQIAMMLSLKELGALCKTNKEINRLCKDEDFWHLRYIQDFNPYLGQFDPYPGDPKERNLLSDQNPKGKIKSWQKLYRLRSMYYLPHTSFRNGAIVYQDPVSGDVLFKGHVPDSPDSNPDVFRSCLLTPNRSRQGQAKPLSMNEIKSLVRHYQVPKAGYKKAEKCLSLYKYLQSRGTKFHPASNDLPKMRE